MIGFQIKGHNEALTGSSVSFSPRNGAMLVLVVAMLCQPDLTCYAYIPLFQKSYR